MRGERPGSKIRKVHVMLFVPHFFWIFLFRMAVFPFFWCNIRIFCSRCYSEKKELFIWTFINICFVHAEKHFVQPFETYVLDEQQNKKQQILTPFGQANHFYLFFILFNVRRAGQAKPTEFHHQPWSDKIEWSV